MDPAKSVSTPRGTVVAREAYHFMNTTLRTSLAAASLLLLPAALIAEPAGAASPERASAQQPLAQQQQAGNQRAAAEIRIIRQSDLKQRVSISDIKDQPLLDASGRELGRVHDLRLPHLEDGNTADEASAEIIIALANGDDEAETEFLALSLRQISFNQESEQLRVNLAAPALTALLGGGFAGAGSDVEAEETNADQGSQHFTAEAQTAATTQRADAQRGESMALAAEQGSVAVTDEGPTEPDPANMIAPVAVAAPSGSEPQLEVSTTGLEVEQIQQALANAEQTRELADQIGVMSATEAVLITGTVQSEQQRDLVLEVVRQTTERDVRDMMMVAETAAE
jgi:hypothetical protein